MLLMSDIVWRLSQAGVPREYYQIRYALTCRRVAVRPRKNNAGHFMFSESDYKAIETYFRAKEAKKA